MSEAPRGWSARLAGAGPALLTFALLFGGAIALGVLQGRYGAPEPSPSAVAPTAVDQAIAGWRGPADLALDGLTLRLTPLHADPERQAFDAASLARRLGLDPSGQPWRLEVTWEPGDGAPARSDRTEGEAAVDAILTGLDGGGLHLADRGGVFAGLLAQAAEASPTLRGLFDPARTFDHGAATGQLHLWGRAPGEGLVLRTGVRDLLLVPAEFERGEVPTFVAHRFVAHRLVAGRDGGGR